MKYELKNYEIILFKFVGLNCKNKCERFKNETYHVKTSEKHMLSHHEKKLFFLHKIKFCKYELLRVHFNLTIDFVALI